MSKWDRRFFSLAEEVASWSKDPASKVGAVLVSPSRREFAVGYNGFPKHVKDCPHLLVDKQSKLALTVHAEANAIANADRDLTGWSLYCTKAPCVKCVELIIAIGIIKVYCAPILASSKWCSSNLRGLTKLKRNNIDVYFDRDGVFVLDWYDHQGLNINDPGSILGSSIRVTKDEQKPTNTSEQ